MAWAPLAMMAGTTLYDRIFGGKDKFGKVSTMTKDQQRILNQLSQMLGPDGQLGQGYQGALQYQQDLMDPNSEAVRQFSQPYMNQFEQQTVPGLAERFAGMGGMGGGLSSSGFGQSLSAAGGNLQAQLAALKAGLGQQAAGQLMSQYGQMANMGLNAQPFMYTQPQTGAFPNFLQSWGQSGFPGMSEMGSGISDMWQQYGPSVF
jgi:hypothetical protein